MAIGLGWYEVLKNFLTHAVSFGGLETSVHLPGYEAVTLHGSLAIYLIYSSVVID